jgi:hypothetical protein
MTPEQSDLVERIRALLVGEAPVGEVAMFGDRAFVVNEKMIVSVRQDGGLVCAGRCRSLSHSITPVSRVTDAVPGR